MQTLSLVSATCLHWWCCHLSIWWWTTILVIHTSCRSESSLSIWIMQTLSLVWATCCHWWCCHLSIRWWTTILVIHTSWKSVGGERDGLCAGQKGYWSDQLTLVMIFDQQQRDILAYLIEKQEWIDWCILEKKREKNTIIHYSIVHYFKYKILWKNPNSNLFLADSSRALLKPS